MQDQVKETTVSVKWLGKAPNKAYGVIFGLPWTRGDFWPGKTSFDCTDEVGQSLPLQTWVTGYWPDGSIKWTGHALPAQSTPSGTYHITGKFPVQQFEPPSSIASGIRVTHLSDCIEVFTGALLIRFPTSGPHVVSRLNTGKGTFIAENGHLVLLADDATTIDSDGAVGARIRTLQSFTESVTVSEVTQIRAIVTVRGRHQGLLSREASPDKVKSWIPFILRFYLYVESEAIRVVHTIILDGDTNNSRIRGIGLRFDVPLDDTKSHNRHVRIAGSENKVFSEAVQSVTGLWKDPGIAVRDAQVQGKQLPPQEQWNSEFVPYLKWVPEWNDFTLAQLSPDGFTLKKRTKPGQAWVRTTGGTRASGLAYLGSPRGGLALGLRDFWERYPTSIDIRGAANPSSQITLWLYSPLAEPMELNAYHDGLGQQDYDDQLDALKITYEDWESGLSSAYGIARTNEILLFGLETTPSSEELNALTAFTRSPPVLLPSNDYVYSTLALGNLWSPNSSLISPEGSKETLIDRNLDFLFKFYRDQVSQRRWYGFWDYGDIMHTYDSDRHVWRYDIGGYAWDNSELSPDLWLWYYFLRTGREDVYRLAEALTRHTGEVDVYHLGPLKGLGTRHGVQHWSDSCKQLRVSNALYRRTFYYISGGDERVGELLEETLEAEKTLLVLDPYRKVRADRGKYVPRSNALGISLGTDWTALAATWFIDWERRGPTWQQSLAKLQASMKGIGSLKNGFVTGMVAFNLETGEVAPPVVDPTNNGVVRVSHLSAMFGLVEICSELFLSFGETLPEGFQKAWLDYCQFYNAPEQEQVARFGKSFGRLILRQGHSRLTAFASNMQSNIQLAERAWSEFYKSDGYDHDFDWKTEVVNNGNALERVEEAPWISTNITALYGLAAIQNLALLGSPPPCFSSDTGLIYRNTFENAESITGWVREGPVEATVSNNTLELSADANFLFWIPEEFPDDIRVSWEFCPVNEPGLAMFFIGAQSVTGGSIFEEDLAPRNGAYPQYHSGDIRTLHASYFRRRWVDERQFHLANLRKSPGFHLVAQGADPLPPVADNNGTFYKVEVVKKGKHFEMSIDGLLLFSWDDDCESTGPEIKGGRIGFRQMSSLVARYRNLEVWKA